jgi:septum site-determining protein MinC
MRAEGMEALVREAAWSGAPGWLVLPDPTAGAGASAAEQVERALQQATLLARGGLPAAVKLATGDWRLDVRALRAIAEGLASHGVALVGLCSRDPRTRVAASALGLPCSAPLPGIAPTAAESRLTLHQGTLRAGDHLEVAGSVLVLGDVNPGARVSAGGDVLVWGRLRGTAHAGCAGDGRARIVALQLRPLQLRIATAVARGPEELPPEGLAEQAVLVDGAIQLQPAQPTWPLLERLSG